MSAAADIHKETVSAWNRRDYARLRNLCHEDYTYTGGDGAETPGGPETAVSIAQMFANAFPDGTLTVKNVYTSGNTAIAEMVGRGTHTGNFMGVAATGRLVEITICNVLELRDGKIYREREYMDMLTVMTQLGAVSMPAAAKTA